MVLSKENTVKHGVYNVNQWSWKEWPMRNADRIDDDDADADDGNGDDDDNDDEYDNDDDYDDICSNYFYDILTYYCNSKWHFQIRNQESRTSNIRTQVKSILINLFYFWKWILYFKVPIMIDHVNCQQ